VRKVPFPQAIPPQKYSVQTLAQMLSGSGHITSNHNSSVRVSHGMPQRLIVSARSAVDLP
jgi:hypothetical protein